jgi:hypothetical protein
MMEVVLSKSAASKYRPVKSMRRGRFVQKINSDLLKQFTNDDDDESQKDFQIKAAVNYPDYLGETNIDWNKFKKRKPKLNPIDEMYLLSSPHSPPSVITKMKGFNPISIRNLPLIKKQKKQTEATATQFQEESHSPSQETLQRQPSLIINDYQEAEPQRPFYIISQQRKPRKLSQSMDVSHDSRLQSIAELSSRSIMKR